MKYVSWNVNGLRAVVNKDLFAPFVEAMDADAICLQETKMQPDQLKLEMEGYHQYFNSAERKGYSGVAVFSRKEPLSVFYGMGIEEHDHEGRLITCEFEDHYLVCCYTPNSKDGLLRLDYRQKWEDDFRAYLNGLREKKSVILCGDLNVAHNEIDLKNPDENHFSAGFSDQEREKMTALLESGFKDSFRELYPEEVKYSWWSYRSMARQRGVGWRIDYFIVSKDFLPRVKDAFIYDDIYGSDHCPVGLCFE